MLSANDKIGEVFLYEGIVDGDIFALTGIKTPELFEAARKNEHPLLKRNDRIFRLICQEVDGTEENELSIVFGDVTNLEELKEKYNKEKICIAKIQIDNYDELIANTPADLRLSVPNEIDRILRRWAEKINASLNKMKEEA